MRDNGSEKSLGVELNNKVKSIAKNTSYKGSIFYKIIDYGADKVDCKKDGNQITKNDEQTRPTRNKDISSINNNVTVDLDKNSNEPSNHYDKSFLYSEEIKKAIEAKFIQMQNSSNRTNLTNNLFKTQTKLSSKENNKRMDTIQSNSTDSRVTGGGKDTAVMESILSKKGPRENSTTRKVSFKVRHPIINHRKNPSTEITVTTLTSSKVAALTQKFNDLIKENDSLLKEPKLAKVVDRIQSCRNKNIESNSSTPNSTLSSNVSVKILTNNKVHLKRKPSLKAKSASNSSLDKVHKLDSPNLHRKVIRVRSENVPKKKYPIKKRDILYKKMDFSYPEKTKSVRDIREKYNKPSAGSEDLKTSSNVVKRKHSIKSSPSRKSIDVQATIKKFESNKTVESCTENKPEEAVKETPLMKLKPDVPIKKTFLYSNRNVVLKDGIPKLKIQSNTNITNDSSDKTESPPNDESVKDNEENYLLQHTDSIKKVKKQILFYDKIKFKHKTMHPDKFQRTMSKTCEIDPNDLRNDSEYRSSEENLNSLKSEINSDGGKCGDDSGVSLTDDEKLYQEVSSRIKPNESFLWRGNVKIDTPEINEYEAEKPNIEYSTPIIINTENEYDYVGPSSIVSDSKNLMEVIAEELDCPSFDTFIKKADELLNIKKREIAEELRKECRTNNNEPIIETLNLHVKNADENIDDLVEAINIPVIIEESMNDDIILSNSEERYEPLEPFRSHQELNQPKDSTETIVQPKRNCPLPELPRESNENCYHSIEDSAYSQKDSNTIHTYEYCPSKKRVEKASAEVNDEGYEYCKSPRENEKTNKLNEKDESKDNDMIKHDQASTLYETIPSNSVKLGESLYETIPLGGNTAEHIHDHTYGENYDECCDENIYDTIKQPDSISNCYESIPGSPHSVVRMRDRGIGKYNPRALLLNKLSFDSISNFSQTSSISTVISENKTNSIYGQRSLMSFERSETTTVYGGAPSESSSSGRSDEWVDMSDQEESSEDPTIIIIREKAKKSRRSPASWSRKVRYQWNVSPKKNDFTDSDSSDKEHLYESLSHANGVPDLDHCSTPYADDIDSFDSDSDTEQRSFHVVHKNEVDIHNAQLPEPPASSNIYTLTKFASAAGKKMRQLKSNFTKSTRKKSNDENKNLNNSNEEREVAKKGKLWPSKDNAKSSQYTSHSAISANNNIGDRTNGNQPFSESNSTQYPVRNAVSNINLSNTSQLNLELASAISERKLKSQNSSESVNNVSANTSSDTSMSPVVNNKSEKDSIMLSRTYLSFKSKFKRNSSVIETNSRSLSLSLTNSVFYLNDIDDSEIHRSDPQLTSETSSKEESNSSLNVSVNSSKKNSQERLTGVEANENNSEVPKPSPRTHRKSVTSIKSIKSRPTAPPPPPPIDTGTNGEKKGMVRKEKRTNSGSSWYAECGLFKATEPYKPESNGQPNDRKSSASWYSEVGLYQIGNISSSSSSGASCTTSTTSVPSPPPSIIPSMGMFNQEPLYQFYNAAKLESVCREIGKDSDLESDGYEEIANFREGHHDSNSKVYQRPSAMTLINPQKGPSRTLWCEIPEVINSRILDTLTSSRKQLQEAMFEIITSEASYLNSLIVLESQFMQHPAFQDNSIISETDHKNLFGNVIPVKHCSEQMMADLEQCWQDSILLRGLCKIIHNHAVKNFHVYVKYCECQVFLIKALKKLKLDDRFNDNLLQIQSKPACQGLSLHSFLMLPMQRITRLPLLMDAVLKNLEKSDDEYQDCLNALSMLNNIVSQCNEGARKTERIEEITDIARKIDFPPNMKRIPIIANNSDINPNKLQRWLVRSGELTQLVWRGEDQSKLTFGKKFTKISLHLFLFTDLLIVTKKKSEDSFMVVDYCKRSLIELTGSDMIGQAPVKDTAGKHTMLLTLLENYENKTVEMLLSCVSESDRQRWMEACMPPPSDNPNETIYEGWDCPQVVAMYPYQTTQPDELNLQQGDIVNVSKKMTDGWFHGERISDGEKGWFPGNYTVEIASQHVRAKNLRQRYRLLALTGTYLGQKKK